MSDTNELERLRAQPAPRVVSAEDAQIIAKGLALAAATAEAYTKDQRPEPTPGSPKDTWRKALNRARAIGLLEDGR
jgi:hypothetical protein